MTEPIPTIIPVFIPDADAKKFLVFQEHYDLFTLMLEKGVFKQKNAAITLNFDSNGTLQTIQRSDFMYSLSAENRLRRQGDLSTGTLA